MSERWCEKKEDKEEGQIIKVMVAGCLEKGMGRVETSPFSSIPTLWIRPSLVIYRVLEI